MKRNLISEMMEVITPKFITNTAHALNEEKNSVSNSLNNLVPAILYQLNHKLEGTKSKTFFQFLKKEKHISFTDQFSGLLENKNAVQQERNDISNGFVDRLFDTQQEGVLDFVSQKNQLQSNSASALMTIASSLVIGYCSKMIRKKGLNFASFKSHLLGQQNEIESALPAGLINWLGNLRPLSSTATSTTQNTGTKVGAANVAYASAASPASDETTATGASYSWAKWLLLPLLLLAAGWWFMNSNSTSSNQETIADKKTTPTRTVETSPLVEVKEIKEELAVAESVEKPSSNDIAKEQVTNNNVSTKTKNPVKADISRATVTISDPIQIEEDVTGIVSSSEKKSSMEMNSKGFDKKEEVSINDKEALELSAGSANSEGTRKVRYEEYIAKTNMPESGKVAASEIIKKGPMVPQNYRNSRTVENGMSSDVKIIKKREMVLKSRETSQPMADLRKTLSLTVYNAWFGEIENPISSTEYRLYDYLGRKSINNTEVDKYTWFNLNQVKFPEYGSKMDFESSKLQLTRIANILNAYPNVQLKVGGFTSDIGKRKANRKLSLEMAEQLKAALVKLGVDENRLSVKGYGESRPRSLNDTEHGRMKNHRVGFRVMTK